MEGCARLTAEGLVNVFIDVDYTLLAANGSLRPHARELFARLNEAGHTTFVWSGTGIRRSEMEAAGLDGWISGYLIKPLEDFQEVLGKSKPPAWPDLIVDDHAEIVDAFGGMAVAPYFFSNEGDRELRRVADALLEYAATGECGDAAFSHPPAVNRELSA